MRIIFNGLTRLMLNLSGQDKSYKIIRNQNLNVVIVAAAVRLDVDVGERELDG